MMAPAGEDYSTLDSIRKTGGVRLNEHWEANLEAAKRNAEIASRLGLDLCTFHAGFIPDDSDDALHDVMVDRLRAIVDAFADQRVRIGFETGQERAETLLEAMDEIDRPTLGVNFDPANMILYGMGEPVHAIELLAPRILQIHIKDARPSDQAGQWGTETRAGDGAVDWGRFFKVVRERCPEVDLVIEREGGDSRVADVRAARELLGRLGVD
jgi:sugar phosphate isomerase/epimerase